MIPSEDLTGRVAIVTGAGQGMGRAVARALAARGAHGSSSTTGRTTAEDAAAELREGGAEAIAILADVTDRAAVRADGRRGFDRYGAIHILVNNAGILRPTQVIDIPEAEWD